MAKIQPVNNSKLGFSGISTGRSSDNSHAYIASRINELYTLALTRQSGTASSARSLKRFIDSNSEGQKLHKII